MKYIREVPIIGIIRGADNESIEGAVEAALSGGIRTLEITLSRSEAFGQITMLKSRFGDEIEIGAGTVLDERSAKKAIEAGAEFIVIPAVIHEVVEYCRSRKVPVFPGAMTPTEIFLAHRRGAEMIKIFPAGTLGPGYFKSLKAPFPKIRLMATGGVTVENAADYFRAGADAIGIGGDLFKKEWLAQKYWNEINETAKRYLDAYMSIQK
jgi:2-dehydro-3-deoxyphosphogluconate aldolase / (4S)-4-hydroxy-2-oxoglutarate aldolase